jgi:hypothetical protein
MIADTSSSRVRAVVYDRCCASTVPCRLRPVGRYATHGFVKTKSVECGLHRRIDVIDEASQAAEVLADPQ